LFTVLEKGYMTAWSYRTAGNASLHVGIKMHLTKQDPYSHNWTTASSFLGYNEKNLL